MTVALTVQGFGGVWDDLVGFGMIWYTGGDLRDVKCGEICGTGGAGGISETQAGNLVSVSIIALHKCSNRCGGHQWGSPKPSWA